MLMFYIDIISKIIFDMCMIIIKNDDFVNLLYMRLYEFHLFLPTSGRSLNIAGARDVTRQLVYIFTAYVDEPLPDM